MTELEEHNLFESGAMLNRNYAGHEQMLMNEGTFIEILRQQTEALRKENQALKAELLASHPAQAGGMPGEIPTDEEIAHEANDYYYNEIESNNAFRVGANWLKSRITETKNK